MNSTPDLISFGERLRQARERRFGKDRPAADAARSLGINEKTYAAYERGERRPKPEAMWDIAQRLRVSYGWLAFAKGPESFNAPAGSTAVNVEGVVQAGAWTKTFIWPDSEQYEVFVPDHLVKSAYPTYAAEVRGESMNKAFPHGSIVILERCLDHISDLSENARYHVEISGPDGTVESTLKTVKRSSSGKLWLIPETDDPSFEAVSIDGIAQQISFTGKVICSIRSER
ncbi:XRE family transcriptional regulator [Pleomorphomonas koreensis]|uniref:XRE family transcriptional regulator n=1 Tax=Pleomorphomonas koreensis TaxID=257440 RepID=UPI000A0556FA|nr:XRE family transcriptional regulator [Pleomorphomonas koreensis]